jgi:hypothetical protein
MAHVRIYQMSDQELRIARWRLLGLTALTWATLVLMWLAGH